MFLSVVGAGIRKRWLDRAWGSHPPFKWTRVCCHRSWKPLVFKQVMVVDETILKKFQNKWTYMIAQIQMWCVPFPRPEVESWMYFLRGHSVHSTKTCDVQRLMAFEHSESKLHITSVFASFMIFSGKGGDFADNAVVLLLQKKPVHKCSDEAPVTYWNVLRLCC